MGVLIEKNLLVGGLLINSLSGRVTLDGTPVIRDILVYKNRGEDLYESTESDLLGDFSVSVVGNSNDEFRVLIIGKGDEYSRIFESVRV